MRILAIDTALEACAAAVIDTERGRMATESLPMERGHAEALMPLLAQLFGRGEPSLSEATVRDAAAIAALHGASFRRGWSDVEIEQLLTERNMVTHRATVGRSL